MQYLCVHATATLSFCIQDLYKYVSHAYKKVNLKQQFSFSNYPILLDELVLQSIFPPVVHHLPGRLKK